MPIYEFYCAGCHTLYNFFSPRVDVEVTPGCPSGEPHELERRPSRFATLAASDDDSDGDFLPGVDEDRLERAMDQMALEFAGLGEDGEENPRDLARMFRRFSDLGGVEPGPMLEEMLARLETAENLTDIEQEFEDVDEGDAELEHFFRARKALKDWRRRNPRVDETLHFL